MNQSKVVTVGAIELTANDLVEVNREQLTHGRNSFGDSVSPSYRSQQYAKNKYERNSAAGYGNPDLYDTGSFYNSIKFHIDGITLNWQATDDKAPELLSKYGSVLGVYENEPLEQYRKTKLYPLMVQLINAELGTK